MLIARQHIPNMHQWTNWERVFSTWSVQELRNITIEEPLKVVFSTWSVLRYYKQEKFSWLSDSCHSQ
jgi:hypothetical protein